MSFLIKKLPNYFAIFLCLIFCSALNSKDYKTKLQIKNLRTGKVNNFLINIAKSEEQKKNGLMWITNLPQNYGMLFEFEGERMVYMWMKNTKIPLDILFIDESKKIISIKHQAAPENLDVISSTRPIREVLEINGGLADKLGIKIGDVIIVNN